MNATDTARNALERKRVTPQTGTLLDLIERQTPAIERALGGAIGAERFARVVTTEIKRNPKLLECAPETVLGSLMLSAQLALEPGPLGHVYLVPFKNHGKMECTFFLGYRGMIELARRSDRLGLIRAATVYEGDFFEYEERQSGPRLVHRECAPDGRGEIVCDYALATVRVGARTLVPHVKRLWPSEIDAARKRSQLGRKNEGPWQTDEIAMRHKTCIRRLSAWLPMTAHFARALEVDETPAVWNGSEVEADAESVEDAQATEGTEN